ncbi:MAG TPA: hypothetical protein ENF42_03390 [Candidatus Bathyarchaeota archaeon]|nr:hypothetical protein [Candidatus Bathyarchaeota archaeon]
MSEEPPSVQGELIKKFNRILVESIIEACDFGELLLRMLQYGSFFRWDKIAEQPEIFAEALESLLGTYTADIIEERTMRVLSKKLGLDYEDIWDYTFPRSVKKAFEHFKRNVNKIEE